MASPKALVMDAQGPSGSTVKRQKQSPPTPEKGPRPAPKKDVTLADLMAEILAVKLTVNQTSSEIADIRQDMKSMGSRIAELEQRTSDIEDVKPGMVRLEKRINVLESAMEDQENRQRRSNVRIHGLPELAEGDDPIAFVEKVLPTLLKLEFEHPFEVDAAHRIDFRSSQGSPAGPSRAERNPRPFIFHVLRRNQVPQIFRAARVLEPILFKGVKLAIFPDLARETIQRKKRFLGMRPKLKEMGAKYGILHPAKLIVTIHNRTRTFYDPADAQRFLDSYHTPMEANTPD